ncbi:MAG: hypothetical protein AB2669_17645 [Candidatus Thiodiazotropha endolucinida]|nr:hypothetical protein [Candidatus Thiodiazotropha taylori]MCW4250846.1 hypothetical protein [Candidatus Thiodiazotropha endolucinida]MCG8040108.1 hypothetical protein [Candidatus Thiodiazotropha taylori]MCG8104564.1 hypothetical protein [Candidatus Thiodiazotropha taylori]MCG8121840.1 hypothetical protein [Candidatus Thiodiazotropha taylori]
MTDRTQSSPVYMYNVYVNDVHVGEMTRMEYIRLKSSVKTDPRIWVSQMLNVFKVLYRAFSSACLAVPIILFWLSVLVFCIDPESITLIFSEMAVRPHEETGGTLLQVLITIAFLHIGSNCMFGTTFGFINHFEQERNRLLRRYFSVPYEGTVSLVSYSVTSTQANTAD